LDKNFGINSGGLPGNDEWSTISGWFCLFCIRFLPGIALFKKITIELNDDYYSGKQLVIMKESEEPADNFLNDSKQKRFQIKHGDITKGGKLIFR